MCIVRIPVVFTIVNKSYLWKGAVFKWGIL